MCFFSQTEADMSVLAENQFGEMPSPTSLSHWSLNCGPDDDDDDDDDDDAEGAHSLINSSVETLPLRRVLHCFSLHCDPIEPM